MTDNPTVTPGVLESVLADAMARLAHSVDFTDEIRSSLPALLAEPGADADSILSCLAETQEPGE